MAERLARSLAAALLALGGTAGAAPATHTVRIEDMRYAPAVLTVRRGDRVTWVNRDLVPHTVTAAGAFDSGPIAAGASWSTTVAARPGALRYTCSLHPAMSATLTVEDAP